jgi:hypothetical protein
MIKTKISLVQNTRALQRKHIKSDFSLILGIAHATHVNVVEKQIMLLTIKNK